MIGIAEAQGQNIDATPETVADFSIKLAAKTKGPTHKWEYNNCLLEKATRVLDS